ncbi:MAG: ATP-binding cassette domain-containing protein [Pseudobdellovibrio sp.]
MKSTRELIRFILTYRLSSRIIIIILALFATLAGIAVPYFQKEFTQTLSFEILFICTLLAFLSFILLQLTNFLGQREALLAQKVLSQSMYKHILHLKSLTTSDKTVGEMVSLYTTDIPSSTMWLEQTIPYALTTAFPLMIAPLFLKWIYQIPLSLTFGMIVVIIAINIFLARRQSLFFSQFKTLAGQRMGLVNEWIQNIKGLKSLNWVRGFENKIIKKRIEETNNRIAMVTNGQFMNSISSSITFWLNLAVLFFLAFIHQELIHEIDLLAIMWVMGIFLAKPLRQLPWFFTMMFDAWTSIKRLGDFFSLTNIDYKINNQSLIDSRNSLHIKNLSLHIYKNSVLKNISFDIFKGEVVALIGPVGSGKSILIKSIMKETPFEADEIYSTSYSYLPQEPFILSASILENITFDYEKANPESSQKSLLSLKQAQFDIEKDRIANGLNTVIGERGLNISGGQKQRLNLARLFFNPQPLFLLDDPFSAVDVGTEKRLIDILMNYKKLGHSFLVVTQRYEFLKSCDRILFLENGTLTFNGTYQELIQIDRFASFIKGEEQKNEVSYDQ